MSLETFSGRGCSFKVNRLGTASASSLEPLRDKGNICTCDVSSGRQVACPSTTLAAPGDPLAVLDLFFRLVGHASPRELHHLRLLLISFHEFLVDGLRPHERVHQENGSEAREAACWCVLAPAPERPCTSFLKAVRRMLTLLGHKEADKCTFKAFRAGRATSLVAAGSQKSVILAAGEWKSSAIPPVLPGR